jgi:hypothetical protein
MADPFYGLWESRSAGSEEGATNVDWDSIESADSWPLASQIRQLLGEDCAIDSTFFEEIWTSGQPAAVESYRKPRNRDAAIDFQRYTFAELSGLGNFLFTQESTCPQNGRPCAPSVMPSASYAASWLQEPLEYSQELTSDQASAVGSAASAEGARDHGVSCSTQYQRACELLSVSTYSTEAQIKAGYRRMAGEWHPDRLERGSEETRALATKQMTAINEAYCYLRSYSPMAFC